ncbi:MAG: alpha-glucan family phosphorylase, partial [bacterium]|nr:alpha-glucan family phosphorylase [bacterium]
KNLSDDKRITGELYGGDSEMRIQQEIILGIGGIRALATLGIDPVVFHMNEGHSAFLALERIRLAIANQNLSLDEAVELTKAGNVFTTHTPVPAGIDRFSQKLMEKYFADFYTNLAIEKQQFFALGGIKPGDVNEKFSMAVLAINLACKINGVSKLHELVSKNMWKHLWPDIPVDEIPITSITNGVHPSSYISKEMGGLFDRYIGPNWKKKPADLSIWKRVDQIPSEELWRTHERRRERLVAFARQRMRTQLQNRGALSSEIDFVEDILNPEALTIGFARRFATYKRAALLFQDLERLAKILTNKNYPVQIIFAGKAHPMDDPGKQLIKKIIHFSQEEVFRQHIVFLENYSIEIARYMVQGVDVWLNTPRRWLEASGTSGMKAAMNGVINCSILDGWWDEAYNHRVGWAIGSGESYDDHEYQDKVESHALYGLLEHEIIPLFYERGKNNIPKRWIELMKNSMTEICPVFNTNRMIREYTDRAYMPVRNQYQAMFDNNQSKAKELSHWKKQVAKFWPKIAFQSVEHNGKKNYKVGNEIQVTAQLLLDGLSPADVRVEIYHGFINANSNMIIKGMAEPMKLLEQTGENTYRFGGDICCYTSGLYGYTVRVVPSNELLMHLHETGMILWAN